jgi:hypothetical protein
MKIVTAANANYYDHLLRQIVSAHKNLDVIPDVFDLGLTDIQVDALGMMGVDVRDVPALTPEPGIDYPAGYRPKGLHKPAMLVEYCFEHDWDDILYLDADAWIVQPFDFPGLRIGVTRVRDVIVDAYRGTPMEEYVGPFHSGVIFLAAGCLSFLMDWEGDLLEDPSPSDKKSMNKVLRRYQRGQLSMTSLDEYEFNSRTMLPFTKIFHSQGPITR